MLPRIARYIKEKYIYFAFEIGLVLKGVFALLDIAGGIFVYSLSRDLITSNNFIINYFAAFTQELSISTQYFIAAYLLIHGLINLFLVVNLFRNRLWAYPASIIFFSIFIGYQVARFCFTHSPWLLVAAFCDLVIIWLIWHEYKRRLKHIYH